MQESKSCALPLGDSPLLVNQAVLRTLPKRWIEGLEPSASRATIWRASQLRHTHHIKRKTCSKGFEPPTHGLEGRCSIQLSYEHVHRTFLCEERVMGIEPTYPAWKAGVLPLNYTRIVNCCVGVTGFEPATSWSQTRRSSQAEPHPARDHAPVLTTHVPLYNTAFFLSTAFFYFSSLHL